MKDVLLYPTRLNHYDYVKTSKRFVMGIHRSLDVYVCVYVYVYV